MWSCYVPLIHTLVFAQVWLQIGSHGWLSWCWDLKKLLCILFQYIPDIFLLFHWVLMQNIRFWILIPDAGIYLTESIYCLAMTNMYKYLYIFSWLSTTSYWNVIHFFAVHSRIGNSVHWKEKCTFFFSRQLLNDRVEWWGLGSAWEVFLVL